MKQPGVEHAVAVPGPVDQRLHQQLQPGIVFVTLKPFDERKSADAERRRDRAAAEPAVRRHPGRLHRDVPAAAGAGPRHHRRLQAGARGPRLGRLRRPGHRDEGLHGQGLRRRRSSPGMFSSFQVNVPQLYADIDRTKAQPAGRAGDGHLRHDADLPRQPVRERLQHVRPHLLGARAGGRAVPRARRGHRPAEGALAPPARWCRCRR